MTRPTKIIGSNPHLIDAVRALEDLACEDSRKPQSDAPEVVVFAAINQGGHDLLRAQQELLHYDEVDLIHRAGAEEEAAPRTAINHFPTKIFSDNLNAEQI
jgi:hypothetical protein